MVGLGLDTAHALELIDQIVHEASCPVIALLDARDPSMVTKAAKRGIFAYVVIDGGPEDLQSAIEITVRRFAEFHNLRAFGRRATIEQAKGILMARNGIDADEAFALLKLHSQRSGQKLVDVAEAITRTHMVLTPDPAVGARPAET